MVSGVKWLRTEIDYNIDKYKRENALCYITHWAFQVALVVKNPPANAGDIRDVDLTLGREYPLEEGMATHTSILAWRIPWTEEPGGLQSIGLHRVGHN